MLKRLLLILATFGAVLTGIAIVASPNSQTPHSEPPLQTCAKKTICLNMIVKNESAVITRCLSSVKDFIDYWVIVDTGSTDGTQEIIKDYMKNVPGILYERSWVDFSHNRNEALSLAKDKADYTLFIDADEILVFSEHFTRPSLDKDLYYVTVEQTGSSDYLRWFLVSNVLDWQWKGVLHEQLICTSKENLSTEIIRGVANSSDTTLGARSKNPRKYLDDAEVLAKGLQKEPDNTRYQFYLAQSYANAGELCLALPAYQRRVDMDKGQGYPEEVFISLYLVARIQEILSMPSNIVIRSYLKAHAHTPSRPEPLFYLGARYMREGKYEKAYDTLLTAINTPLAPTDTLFVETDIPAWRLYSCFAETCWRLNKVKEMTEACKKVAACERAPAATRQEMQNNVTIIEKK